MCSCGTDGKNVVITDYTCWTTEHYIHTTFGITFMVILMVITVPTTAIYFENNCSSTNAYKKVSSTADLMSAIFKAIMTIALILFNSVTPCRYSLFRRTATFS